jgi:hypothetical protein
MCDNGGNNNSFGSSGGPWHSSGWPKGDPNKNTFTYDDTQRKKKQKSDHKNFLKRKVRPAEDPNEFQMDPATVKAHYKGLDSAQAQFRAFLVSEVEAELKAQARAKFAMKISDLVD